MKKKIIFKVEAVAIESIVLSGHSLPVFLDVFADILFLLCLDTLGVMGALAGIDGKSHFYCDVFGTGVVELKDQDIAMLLITGAGITIVDMGISLLNVSLSSNVKGGFIGGLLVVHFITKEVAVSIDHIFFDEHAEETLVVLILLVDLPCIIHGSQENGVLLLLLLPLVFKISTFFLDLGLLGRPHQHEEAGRFCCKEKERVKL